MRIIQISDLHLTENGLARGIDVNNNFLTILNDLSSYQPDLIILTGDICFDYGNTNIYKRVITELISRKINYLIIPGNHDNSELMYSIFKTEFNTTIELNQHLIITMNSSDGFINKIDLEWLQNQLDFTELIPVLFIHYPAINGQVAYMENKYALKNRKELQKILKTKSMSYVFCGHYHCDTYSRQDGIHQFITPSLFFQIHPDKEGFQIENHLIGYRIIDLNDSISTRVRYLKS